MANDYCRPARLQESNITMFYSPGKTLGRSTTGYFVRDNGFRATLFIVFGQIGNNESTWEGGLKNYVN